MSEYKPLKYNIGILLIATNKYTQFVGPLLESIEKNFLPEHNLTVFLFTDSRIAYNLRPSRITLEQIPIPSYKFPEATMLRYLIFTSRKYKGYSHLYYMDVDMLVVGEVGNEILPTLVAVIHPGFYRGGGSWEEREESECYVHPVKRNVYYAGGFQGGPMFSYYGAMIIMREMIREDIANGITPVWHDESSWNCYLSNISISGFTQLMPSYVMVEEMSLRKKWGIDHFEPKIIALKKNHAEIRS